MRAERTNGCRAGFAGAVFARTLVLPGTDPGPTGEMLGGGEDGQVDPELGDEHFGGALIHGGEGVEAGEVIGEGRHDNGRRERPRRDRDVSHRST
jgi:hypothetical protein